MPIYFYVYIYIYYLWLPHGVIKLPLGNLYPPPEVLQVPHTFKMCFVDLRDTLGRRYEIG